ncbi:MAG TPA: hypothetical protein VEA38_16630 [Terriglobales bacterium]|nr:hypothetical protein [Terriglobales bacterium]
MAQQNSQGKRGVQSSSIKQDRANRGGMREMPQTRRVAGAFGKEGAARKTPARAPATGKLAEVKRVQGRRRAA